MKYDVIIRGGTIVDGSGGEAFNADLAIKDGVIAKIGNVEGEAVKVIDASGLHVTPGFVDIHTHLDAQMGWDPDMTPVSWHGVSTALIGNCGMTFAPCKPENRELLAAMMETVEDIPKDAILGGLAWDWEKYGEYLDSIERLGTRVNVAGLVGHAAVRYHVMGERSFDGVATDQEKQQMVDIVSEAIEQGAFGFSTNRFEPHKAPDGRSIPGTFAPVDELEDISEAVSKRNGLMQAVGANFEVLEKIAQKDNSRVLFSYGCAPEEGSGKKAAEALDMLAEGRDVTAISHVRGSGFMFGLQTNMPIKGNSWDELNRKPMAEKLEALRDAVFVAALVDEAKQSRSCGIPLNRTYFLGSEDRPAYTNETTIIEASKAKGEHWSETLIRLSLESEGRGIFNWRMFSSSLREQAELFRSDNIYPGLGDAGAHVSQIMDAGWASFMLSYWQRETGHFSLPEAIQKMTSGPAKVVGLADRGLLQEGMKADVNVINTAIVGELQPVLVNDFPGGAPRWIQRAEGFKATIINGQISLLDGELTGERAGQVLRHSA
jgi:N-acyl-D-aspartate/D-glutamate deacylase